MNWLAEIFTQQTFIQAILVLSLICAAGVALGSVKIYGISLGSTFVFFAGIIAGHFGTFTADLAYIVPVTASLMV